MDKGESPQQAAVREIREEIGLIIKRPKFTTLYCGFDSDNKDYFMAFVFYAGIIEDEKSIKIDNKEIVDYDILPVLTNGVSSSKGG